MTHDHLKDAVILVGGDDRNSFGTAFAIHRDSTSTYILTCAHVLESLKEGSKIRFGTLPVTTIACGSGDDFDLAVLRVEGHLDYPILTCCIVDMKPGSAFVAAGFHSLSSQRVAETFEGTLDKAIRVESSDRGSSSGWYINLDSGSSLLRGSSGAPVVHRETGFVIGLITHSMGETRGVALSLDALNKVWPDAPIGLLDTPEGYKKQLLVLDLLRGLPEELPDIVGFQQLAALRESLSTKRLQGDKAFSLAAAAISEVASQMKEKRDVIAAKVQELEKDLDRADKALVAVELESRSLLSLLVERERKVREEILVEVERFFSGLAEDVGLSCLKFIEKNPMPIISGQLDYSKQLVDAVNSDVLGEIETWYNQHFANIISIAQKELHEEVRGIVRETLRRVEPFVASSSVTILEDSASTVSYFNAPDDHSAVRPLVGREDVDAALYVNHQSVPRSKEKSARQVALAISEKSISKRQREISDFVVDLCRERSKFLERVAHEVSSICARARDVSAETSGIEEMFIVLRKSNIEFEEWIDRISKVKARLGQSGL